ncbi:hypothetical protein TorRG33x02_141410 [Trema orientale]|uniref:Uncharacterized protein n=1 Tax=Trema orientale TaxID=63057 RepID=A0A2P5EX47_TREOI|nr:hypothetical protein TorRG33x02_141410 [Trema orientale]
MLPFKNPSNGGTQSHGEKLSTGDLKFHKNEARLDEDRARVAVNLVMSDHNMNKEKLCSDAKEYYRTRFAAVNFSTGSKNFQRR